MSSGVTNFPTIDEAARSRFEAAWRDGGPPSLREDLPAEGDPAYLPTLEELVHIELEMVWKGSAGADDPPRPRVEDYLARFPRLRDPAIVWRLVRQEFQVRHLYGDRPDRE